MKTTAVILAAGQGTRMRSAIPKPLHLLCGKSLIAYSLDNTLAVTSEVPVVIVSPGQDQVRQNVGDAARFAVQTEQLGTANAVLAAAATLERQTDAVLVMYVDMPLLRPDTLRRLIQTQTESGSAFSLLTMYSENPRGFGRIVRSADTTGNVLKIVEEAQATAEELAIKELNVGCYCFKGEWLWDALRRVKISPKGEYYLTDLVEIAVSDGLAVQSILLGDETETIGINNRQHLAEAEAIQRQRINRDWMLAGVTLIDSQSTYIEASVRIGQDTVIFPNTILRGNTVIGGACEIGPNTIINNTQVGDRCTVLASVLEGAVVEDEVGMGPFAHLRKGAYLCQGVHMGNFGEVKNSTLGKGSKMGHFSYIGDAKIGEDVNIGAGTITCNFDGKNKLPTVIGDHVFIGSDTMLVAPLTIGEGAKTGAGAVVNRDVPPYTLVVGVPARPLRKLEKSD